MGFFDFLAGKDEAEGPLLPDTSGLSATRAVGALLAVPKVARGEAWRRRFLAQVGDAAFYCGDPRIVQGPDPLPYFALHAAQDNQLYPSHVIHHMQEDFLLDQGLGVVINPVGQDADYAFSFGDIVQHRLTGAFYPTPEAPRNDPWEALPAGRKALRGFLQGLGVAEPGLLIAARDRAGAGSRELVFNFAPEQFTSLDAFRLAMGSISWFLPRHFSYSVAGKEARQAPGFQPL